MSESQSRQGATPSCLSPLLPCVHPSACPSRAAELLGCGGHVPEGPGGGAVGAFCSSVFPLSVGRDLAQLAAPALASLIKVPVTTAQQDKTASVRSRCPPGPLIPVSQSHSKHPAGRPGAQPRNFVAADVFFLLKA